MEQLLEQVKDFADRAHGKQMRKYTPERYIVHPVRVMEMCSQYDKDPAVLAAALLHDVLEDTPVTRDEIKEFLQTLMDAKDVNRTLGYVVELTDIFTKENYPDWNRLVRKEKELERLELISPQAQTIKYADIADNCLEIVKHDREFAPKFLKECRSILKKLDKGDPILYEKAKATITAALASL